MSPAGSPHGAVVIGAGAMGRAHAAAWTELEVPVLYAVAPRLRPELPSAPGARWVTELGEALADPRCDVVSVCTPTPSHVELAVQALDAGRHVLLEKPIALTVADAERLAGQAARASATLMVAHVVRFFADYAALAARVAAGSVGRPRTVRASRLSAAPQGAEWLEDEERSGGLLVDFAIHDVDQACLLLGDPVAVTAVCAPGGGFGAPAAITVEFAEGGVAQLLAVSDLPAGTPFSTSLEVVGDRGVDTLTGAAGDPFVAQARYFLDCVETGTEPTRAPIAAAVQALRVCLAARESARTGRRVVLGD